MSMIDVNNENAKIAQANKGQQKHWTISQKFDVINNLVYFINVIFIIATTICLCVNIKQLQLYFVMQNQSPSMAYLVILLGVFLTFISAKWLHLLGRTLCAVYDKL